MPADLVAAIDHAQKIISWQENLMADEMPPSWMWHLDHELVVWFDAVEERRKSKFGDGSESSSDGGDQPMLDNEFAARMRG